jgi:5-methylthioadenosine/S-adenosylhomocysteine deaminase
MKWQIVAQQVAYPNRFEVRKAILSQLTAGCFMDHVDTLIAARWIVPIEPFGTVLDRHAIAIRDGRIVAIEPEQQARERFAATRIVSRPTHVVLPGFVNAHTHGAMTLLRGAAESNRFEHWLQTQVWPLEQRWMDAEYVRDGTELAIADMLTSGTTCFADMHLFPEVVAQTAAEAKMRACIGTPIVDFATAWAGSVDEYFDKGLRLHDEYRNDPLISTMLAPYAPWAVEDATLRRVQRLADELELPVTMHVNEATRDNPPGAERAVARLERLGLLSPLLTAIHMIHTTAEDLERVARAGISIAHCPQSNLKLGNGIAPIAAFLQHGVNITLGTDGAASNNDLSMLDEMRTAALLASGTAGAQGPTMGAHDWLRIATLNGARALCLADQIGSLQPEKWADLCCIDLHRAHTQPVHDPAAQIVYAASRDQVSDVWVAGRALVEDRSLIHLDLEDLMRRAQLWQTRISTP